MYWVLARPALWNWTINFLKRSAVEATPGRVATTGVALPDLALDPLLATFAFSSGEPKLGNL